MLFSSTLFPFRFLPIVLAGNFRLRGAGARNTWLLIASLVFYGWSEAALGGLMLISIAANWLFGVWAAQTRAVGASLVPPVAGAVALDLALLIAFKYSDRLFGRRRRARRRAGRTRVPLPRFARRGARRGRSTRAAPRPQHPLLRLRRRGHRGPIELWLSGTGSVLVREFETRRVVDAQGTRK